MTDDRDAQFEQLYKYYPAVVALLLRLDFELEDARDLAQQVFVRVYEHMDSYRGESRWSYLEKVAKRLAYNAKRDRHAAKRNGIRVATDEILELNDERTPAPDRALEQKQNTERLRRAIQQLPANEQTSMLLQLSGESYEDMAPALGITASALKSRLHAARRRLRELLGEDPEEMGGTNDQ